jgi:hypothetical protein
MSKAIIVVDFAYKGPQRRGRGTGHQGLRSTLKYLQYRNNKNDHLLQTANNERWRDHGLGRHYREIHNSCDQLQSKHVLAWTWVVSPAPDLMALVPESERRQLVCDLTEYIVEDYYLQRGFDIPEYSYVLHDRETNAPDAAVLDQPEVEGQNCQRKQSSRQHLHTHIILPGTAPLLADRQAVYNNKEKGHDRLFREIATEHFTRALDEIVGPEWRRKREEEPEVKPDGEDLVVWSPGR